MNLRTRQHHLRAGFARHHIRFARCRKCPLSQVKQLWPLPVADGARRWILPNLFGGMVDDASIDIAFAPGRFDGPGDPPPLAANEIKIDASIENTRFDIVGDLPPVRDASGHVSVRGAHTTIDIERGTAYLTERSHRRDIERASGHSLGTAAAGHGDPRHRCRRGSRGDRRDRRLQAARRAALRQFRSRRRDWQGYVASFAVGFPITRDAPPGSLTWTADMSFDDLSIAKPLDGQMMTSAKGTLKVTRKARRSTRGRSSTAFQPG